MARLLSLANFLLILPFMHRSYAFPSLYTRKDNPCSNKGAACTCMQTTMAAPNWTVIDFDYHARYQFTSPSLHDSFGHISFNLTNPAAGFATRCSARSDQLDQFFYGKEWYNCDNDATKDKKSWASFRFTHQTGLLEINQTWTCTDSSPHYPFRANGQNETRLQCNDTMWENSNWKLSETYSLRTVQCNKTDFMVPWNNIMSGGPGKEA